MVFKEKSIVGIIPAIRQENSLHVPWHNVLMPIAEDINLLQNALHECALFGCDVIYVICEQNYSNIFKNMIGGTIASPNNFYNKFESNPLNRRKLIPIYYSEYSKENLKKRNCFAFSSIHGAKIAQIISNELSKHLIADYFFIKDPFIINDISYCSTANKNIITNYEKNNFLTNLNTPFVLTKKEVLLSNTKFIELEKNEQLKLEFSKEFDRSNSKYAGNNIEFSSIFQQEENTIKQNIELKFIYNINSWEEYCQFLGDFEKNNKLREQAKYFLKHELKPLIIKRK